MLDLLMTRINLNFQKNSSDGNNQVHSKSRTLLSRPQARVDSSMENQKLNHSLVMLREVASNFTTVKLMQEMLKREQADKYTWTAMAFSSTKVNSGMVYQMGTRESSVPNKIRTMTKKITISASRGWVVITAMVSLFINLVKLKKANGKLMNFWAHKKKSELIVLK